MNKHPTATQIIQTHHVRNALVGKVTLITGCTSGIGVPTAHALAETGATLYLGVRDISKAKTIFSDLLSGAGVRLLQLDLSSFESIKRAAKTFLTQSGGQLNILINNGGVMMTPGEMRTEDGLEMQFGTNHVGHFLLFAMLRETLARSVTRGFHSRVVGVTSSAHRGVALPGDMREVGYTAEGRGYDSRLAYGQSKLANVYMMNEIERRYGRQGVHGLSVHPGLIFTGLQRHVSEEMMQQVKAKVGDRVKTVDEGAATTVVAAVAPEWEGVGGVYLEDCGQGEPVRNGFRNGDRGFDERIWDTSEAKRLWAVSEKLVGLDA